MTTYVPTVFTKNGDEETAETWEDHWNLIWDGWRAAGAYQGPIRPPFTAQQEGALSATIDAAAKPLKGKTVVLFGDSNTELTNYPETFAAITKSTVTDAGVGGTRMGYSSSSDHDALSMYRLAVAITTNSWTAQDAAASALGVTARVNALKAVDFSTLDHAVIAFGTNDFGGSLPLGTSTDTEGTTFRGAINKTVSTLLAAYPQLRITLATPVWRARQATGDGKDADTFPNSSGLWLHEYVAAIIEAARKHSLPVVDLYNGAGINRHTHATFLSDGLHLSDAGGAVVGSLIADGVTHPRPGGGSAGGVLAAPATGDVVGDGTPIGAVTPAYAGQGYTDRLGTTGVRRWIATGTTSSSWQVAHGDTGWRRIASWTAGVQDASNQIGTLHGSITLSGNGYVQVRRVNGLVVFNIYGTLTMTNTAVNLFTTNVLPLGFRPLVLYSGTPLTWGNSVPIASISSSGGPEYLLLYRSTAGAVSYSNAQWATGDAWPTTLPGVAG